MKKKSVAGSTTFLLAFACSMSVSRAQTGTGCPDPCTATINFNYSGVDITGIGGSSSGSGSFTVPVGFGNPETSPGINDVSSFQFSQTTSVPVGTSTYSYSLGNLTSFSLNFGNASPSLSPSNVLFLQTSAVGGSNSNFFPESFSVNAANAQTFNNAGQQLQSGTVTLNQASIAAAIVQGAVQVQTTDPLNILGQPTAIQATFAPNFNLTLAQAAALSGFTGYDWVQTVTSDPTHASGLKAPFNDPPDPPRDHHIVSFLEGAKLLVIQ